jgi:hypothetical protein
MILLATVSAVGSVRFTLRTTQTIARCAAARGAIDRRLEKNTLRTRVFGWESAGTLPRWRLLVGYALPPQASIGARPHAILPSCRERWAERHPKDTQAKIQ